MFDLKAFREQSLPTQAQITSQWDGSAQLPLVSVICTAFNQESYIEDALKGFLMQKTDFPFEIIIHDDASLDKTADIINYYAKKYPLIIKPILQEKNQYTINAHLPFKNSLDKSVGEYLALCEGDDFWINPEKLKIQISLMKKHPKINISFHSSGIACQTKVYSNRIVAMHYKVIKTVNLNSVIKNGGGYMPTASLLIKRDVLLCLPLWFYSKAPVGDYYIQVLASSPYGALFVPEIMSAYRVDVEGSWSNSMHSHIKVKKVLERMVECNKYLSKDLNADERIKISLKKNISIASYSFLKNINIPLLQRKEIYMRYKNYFSVFQKLFWLFILSNKSSLLLKKIKNIL